MNIGPKVRHLLAMSVTPSKVKIHAAWNEPSSNAIMEAMACGLPVTYRDSGGNRELAGDYGVPLTDDPADVVDHLKEHYVELRKRTIEDGDKFAIKRAADEYPSLLRYAIDTLDAGIR